MLYDLINIIKNRSGKKTFQLHIKRLQIAEGSRIAITGPSGCGKSTTLDILGLSLAPDKGDKFSFEPPAAGIPVNILDLWAKRKFADLASLRLANLGYVLQTGELFPFLTAGENLQFVALMAGQDKRETLEIAREMAKRLDIYDLWESYPGALSVGERQRVAIGRALTARPRVILADEPTAALDPLHAEEVMKIFLDSLSDFGSGLLLVTHNRQWALEAGLSEAAFNLEKSEEGATIATIEYPLEKGVE